MNSRRGKSGSALIRIKIWASPPNLYIKNRTAGWNHGAGSFLVAPQSAQAAVAARTAGRGETAFSIFCWLKIREFDLLFLFLFLWFVLHGTFHLFVVCCGSDAQQRLKFTDC